MIAVTGVGTLPTAFFPEARGTCFLGAHDFAITCDQLLHSFLQDCSGSLFAFDLCVSPESPAAMAIYRWNPLMSRRIGLCLSWAGRLQSAGNFNDEGLYLAGRAIRKSRNEVWDILVGEALMDIW